MGLKHIGLAPGFAREVLDVYEAWERKDAVPWKFEELMLVIRIEVARRYNPPQESVEPKIKELRQTRLSPLR